MTEQNWIIIGDKEYDVTQFHHKHPGGSIIKYMFANNGDKPTGADATRVYTEMHYRSKTADKYLATLPNRPAKKFKLNENV